MNARLLVAIAAIILSLGFEFIPKLDVWYAGQSKQVKRLIMAGLMLVSAVGAYLLSCYSPYEIGIACNQDGVWKMIELFVVALVTNQGTHLIAKRDSSPAVS